jgi:hypothetical protein
MPEFSFRRPEDSSDIDKRGCSTNLTKEGVVFLGGEGIF